VLAQGSATAADLAEDFQVSLMTIHRDLDELQRLRHGRGGFDAVGGLVVVCDAQGLESGQSVAGVATTGPDGKYAFAALTGGQYTVTASG
jgi:DeoR/GlpR family transcriptional regulator of sugar metabolism